MKRATAKKVSAKKAPEKAKKVKEAPAPKAQKVAKAAAAKPASSKPVPAPAPKAAAKPAAPTAPVTLGLKRSCPKCSTKFYDFAKSPILCPKCGAEVDPDALLPKIPRKAEQKKKSADKVAEAVLAGEDGAVDVDPIEAADDLGDDDVVVEEIVVDDDMSDDEF